MRNWANQTDDSLTALSDEDLINSEKSPSAYRTISEVATILHVPQHVLRFWESKFPQIKPLKRGGGRRFYKPEDVDLLRGIRHLLYGEGYTIKGVQKLIKENGIKSVQNIAKLSVLSAAPNTHGLQPNVSTPKTFEPVDVATYVNIAREFHIESAKAPQLDAFHPHPMFGEALNSDDAAINMSAFATEIAAVENDELQIVAIDSVDSPVDAAMPEDLSDELPDENSNQSELTSESVRKLQSILFELNECKRVLAAALTTYSK